jgi:hypothetical protein
MYFLVGIHSKRRQRDAGASSSNWSRASHKRALAAVARRRSAARRLVITNAERVFEIQ